MDNEEFEQIPWSSLMTDKAQGVDPKVYVVVGIVGVVVAVIFGVRLFSGSGSQPTPPIDSPAAVVSSVARSTTTAGLIVSEADLMAGPAESGVDTGTLRDVAFAEWFITDYFTVDGSSENERSLRALLAPTASNLLLPQLGDAESPTMYVEWARAVTVRDIGAGQVEVDVVYRTITETEAGFVRDPVSAAVVTVRSSPVDAGVVGLPVPIDVPMPGSAAASLDAAAQRDN